MKAKKNNIKALAQFKDKHYGKRGSVKREKLEDGYQAFKIEFFLPKMNALSKS